jgi:3-oxoacyl-[acyl-carrier protein] reductase
MARFTNQVALISGGADGLGKGIAALIASEGGKVVLLDSNPSKLEKTESEFKLANY